MRDFSDERGRGWTATVGHRDGADYKGAYYFVLTPADGGGEALQLEDVCWNSARTAERTLATMSVVELRRRLRAALGRAAPTS